MRQDPLACKRQLAYIPDNPDLYEYMTGTQYLHFIADIFQIDDVTRRERIQLYAQQFDLTKDLTQAIAYSHGMKQKLAIVAAWLHAPQLIVMGEPFVGLDPKAAHTLKEMMRAHCRAGDMRDLAEPVCASVFLCAGICCSKNFAHAEEAKLNYRISLAGVRDWVLCGLCQGAAMVYGFLRERTILRRCIQTHLSVIYLWKGGTRRSALHAAEHGVDFRVAWPYGGIAFSQPELDERDRSHQAKRQCAFNAVWRYWIYVANGWRIFSAWLRNRRHGVFGAAVLCERGAGCGAVSMAL